jgi:hypothetical protein
MFKEEEEEIYHTGKNRMKHGQYDKIPKNNNKTKQNKNHTIIMVLQFWQV